MKRVTDAAHQRVEMRRREMLHRLDFRFDCAGVTGDLAGKVGDLGADQSANAHDGCQGQGNGKQSGKEIRHPNAVQNLHQRREQEREQYRKRDGDENAAAKIQAGNDHHAGAQRHHAGGSWRLGSRDRRWSPVKWHALLRHGSRTFDSAEDAD